MHHRKKKWNKPSNMYHAKIYIRIWITDYHILAGTGNEDDLQVKETVDGENLSQ